MIKKYQVFISSTFDDLREERNQVIKAVLEMGHIPVGMEMFSAGDEEQWNIIARQIDDSDYYVVLVANRYGSTTDAGLSYTEKEYDYAVKKGIPVLGFLLDGKAAWPSDRGEQAEVSRARLDDFKTKVQARIVNYWSNKDELHGKVSIALMKAITAYPRTGWARADEFSGPAVTNELSRLSAENAVLRDRVTSLVVDEKEQESQEVRKIAEILFSNQIKVVTRVEETSGWKEPVDATLLTIFRAVSAGLVVENHPEEMAKQIALEVLKSTDYAAVWPVPQNWVEGWLADLMSLGLIEPSSRRHAVSDLKPYWSLTELGRRVLSFFRRRLLEKHVSTGPATTETVSEKVSDSIDEKEGSPRPGGVSEIRRPTRRTSKRKRS